MSKTCCPADLISSEMNKIEEFGTFCKSEEDVLSCVLFPQVAPEFIKRRDNVEVHEIEVVWDGETKERT